MAYRETPRITARKQALRARMLSAARRLVAEDGYRAVRMSRVARRAGVATGTVYRYFPSKTALVTEVFRTASEHELQALRQAAEGDADASRRLEAVIRVFARRALAGRRLAYALLAEPADPAVDAERLVLRRAYARLMEQLLEEGMREGVFPDQDVSTSASALVGALGEALVGPLSPGAEAAPDPDALSGAIVEFSLRAVTGKEPSHEHYRYRSTG